MVRPVSRSTLPRLQWTTCPLPQPRQREPSRTPKGTVVYAIGDIHGCCDLFDVMLQGIEQDCEKRPRERTVVVYLGDYLSRGSDSRAVVNRAMSWQPKARGVLEIIALTGNHEELALRYLGGEMEAGRQWFDHDGLDALADYGVVVTDASARDDASLLALRDRFAQALPQEHLKFFQSLGVSHREQDYHFVHAGVRPGVALADQTAHDQIWIRKRFLESELDHGAVIVHGHSISAEPTVRHNRIGIDTGASASGVLTCLALDGTQRAFLQAIGRSVDPGDTG
jgi:serine/threonine protein phosphatase 1